MRRGPHWLLNDPDAKAYGLALSNALRHLPVTMAQKYVDFTALGIAVMAYEGPRIGIDMQLRAQRAASSSPRRGPQGPAQVFQFSPRPGPGSSAEASPEPQAQAQAQAQGPTIDMTYEPQMDPSA